MTSYDSFIESLIDDPEDIIADDSIDNNEVDLTPDEDEDDEYMEIGAEEDSDEDNYPTDERHLIAVDTDESSEDEDDDDEDDDEDDFEFDEDPDDDTDTTLDAQAMSGSIDDSDEYIEDDFLEAMMHKINAEIVHEAEVLNITHTHTEENNVNFFESGISEESKEKNKTLKPVFIINTFTNTDFGRFINNYTKGTYSHALISTTPSLSHMYSFDDEKSVVINGKSGLSDDNIERYKKMEGAIMRVTCVMVTPEIFKGVRNSINYYIKRANKTRYGDTNLFGWLKGSNKLSSWGQMKLFCSEFTDMILKHNNIDITGSSSRNVHPDDLGGYKMRNNVFIIYEGLCKDFTTEKCEQAIEKLRNTIEYNDLFTMTKKSMHQRSDINLGKENRIPKFAKNAVDYNKEKIKSKIKNKIKHEDFAWITNEDLGLIGYNPEIFSE